MRLTITSRSVRLRRGLRLVAPAVILIGAAACLNATDSAIEALPQLDGTERTLVDIESDIGTIMESAYLAGLQVAVVRDGRISYSSGFGVREAGDPAPVTPRTVFAAMSFSKTMFAYLVLQLVDEGVIDLDQPMESYLPRPLAEYDFYSDLAGDDRAALVTPRMALSHTTGFPNWRWFTSEGRLQFIYEPGERHSYSGEGIFLLQHVVEEVTGEGLEELARRRIFEPFGMRRTSFVFLPEFEDDFAIDHDHYLNPLGKERRDEANSAGSAQTTAEDYARFLIAVMEGEGLSSEMRDAVFSPQIEIEHARMFGPRARVPAPVEAPRTSWGLGWGLVESDHGRAFFHTGNDRGGANYHVGFPDAGVAVVLLGNSQNLERAAPALTRALIGDRYSPYDFLGYEPFESVRGRIVQTIVSEGYEAGRHEYDALPNDEVTRWFPERWAFLDAVGQDVLGLGHADAATELYADFAAEQEQVFGYDRLGGALAADDRHAEAAEAFGAGLQRAAGDPFWSRLYEWKLGWADAVAVSREIPAGTLRDYAGVYDGRNVELREGTLFYFREGTPDPTPRRLFALDDRTFVMENSDSFRLRFDRDANGAVYRITGQYLDSDDDETLRTAEPSA